MTRVQLELLATVFDHADKSFGRIVAIENIIHHAQIMDRKQRVIGSNIPELVRDALEVTAKRHDMEVSDLRGADHRAKQSAARREAMFRIRVLSYSLPEVGKFLGGRHHTTVISGLRKFETENPALAVEIRCGRVELAALA